MSEPTIEETTAFITQAHGQRFRRGTDVPYYSHPMIVAYTAGLIADNLNLSEQEYHDIQLASLLHDLISMSDGTIEMLHKMKYSDHVISIVKLVSRAHDLTRDDIVANVIASGNICAMVVKAADHHADSAIKTDELPWFESNNLDPHIVYDCNTGQYIKLLSAIATVLENKATPITVPN